MEGIASQRSDVFAVDFTSEQLADSLTYYGFNQVDCGTDTRVARAVRPNGFVNPGNDCYLISGLVFLASTPGLTSWVHQLFNRATMLDAKGTELRLVVEELLNSVWGSKSVFRTMIKKLKIIMGLDNEQHDASEVIAKLLELITDAGGRKSHAFEGLCEGVIQTMTTCRRCKTPSDKKDPFLIHQVSGEAKGNLETIFRPVMEELVSGNEYACRKKSCLRTRQPADMSTIVYSSSNVMFFSIGRVMYAEGLSILSENVVCYPPTISLQDGSVFDLNGLVCHRGSSAGSGHYVSYVRNPKLHPAGCWYLVNDDKVRVVDPEVVYRFGIEKIEGERPLILQYVRRPL